MHTKTRELPDEFRIVPGNRLLAAILPPVLFLIANSLSGLTAAIAVSLGSALVMTLFRRSSDWQPFWLGRRLDDAY